MVPRGAGSFFHHAGPHEPFEGLVIDPASNSDKSHTRFIIRPKNSSHHTDVAVVRDHHANRRSEDGHIRVLRLSKADQLTHAVFEAHPED